MGEEVARLREEAINKNESMACLKAMVEANSENFVLIARLKEEAKVAQAAIEKL